jgi:histone demethylase JARID1
MSIRGTSELVCEICSRAEDEENMIICDACDLGYHLQCLGDTDSANDLDFNILEDDWTCGACDASGDDSEANGSDDEGSCSDSSAHASE